MLIDPFIGLVMRNCLPLLSAHECQEATRHVASKALKLDATAKKILVFPFLSLLLVELGQ